MLVSDERLGRVHIFAAKVFNVIVGLSKIACVETPKHLEGLAQRGQNVAFRPIFSFVDFPSIVEITSGELIKALSVHRHGVSSLVKTFVKAKPDSPDLVKHSKASTSVRFCCDQILRSC